MVNTLRQKIYYFYMADGEAGIRIYKKDIHHEMIYNFLRSISVDEESERGYRDKVYEYSGHFHISTESKDFVVEMLTLLCDGGLDEQEYTQQQHCELAGY